jgi:hypothetical protein
MTPDVETVGAALAVLALVGAALAQYRRGALKDEKSARRRFYAAFALDPDVSVDDDNDWRPPTLALRRSRSEARNVTRRASAEPADDDDVRLIGETGPNSRDVPTRWRARTRKTAFARRGRATLSRRGRNRDDGDTFNRNIDEAGDDAARSLFADLTVRAICAELFARHDAQALRVDDDGAVEMELLARGYDVDDARVKVLAVAALVDAMSAAAPAASFPAELPSAGSANRVHAATGAESGTPVAVGALDDRQA